MAESEPINDLPSLNPARKHSTKVANWRIPARSVPHTYGIPMWGESLGSARSSPEQVCYPLPLSAKIQSRVHDEAICRTQCSQSGVIGTAHSSPMLALLNSGGGMEEIRIVCRISLFRLRAANLPRVQSCALPGLTRSSTRYFPVALPFCYPMLT
jgi:hypothetical protein